MPISTFRTLIHLCWEIQPFDRWLVSIWPYFAKGPEIPNLVQASFSSISYLFGFKPQCNVDGNIKTSFPELLLFIMSWKACIPDIPKLHCWWPASYRMESIWVYQAKKTQITWFFSCTLKFSTTPFVLHHLQIFVNFFMYSNTTYKLYYEITERVVV